MDNPRFSDDDHARREGLPGAIVPGIMLQALLAVMIHEWAPSARIRQLDTVFRNPVLVGSRPTCTGDVTNVDEDQRLVELDVSMETEDGVTSVIGTAIVDLGG